ncbi:MAG TPA: hypothetical protein VFX61_18870 [Micromonosporaceae bacterium]|nr:hypothetical protein [Micromonosporaceae bacterium]
MHRFVSSIVVVVGLIGASVGSGAAAAVAAPAPADATAAVPKKVCTIKDPRLDELSGMVATKNGYIVINDGSDDERRKKVFFLDKKCAVKNEVSYSGNGSRDTEDLALSPDGGTLWIADTGDNITNAKRRDTVALWTMPVDGSKQPVIHRLAYPDGPHDAEALLFNGDGTPIIVTKSLGRSELYSPTGPLQPNTAEGVPMKKLGEVRIPRTSTPHDFGPGARMLVTGGATAPDGSRVVLRTYTDAFEWDVTDGDVVAALTTTTPRVTSLPGEPAGEAIAYTPDGKHFLTVSETADFEGVDPIIRSWVPAQELAAPAAGDDEEQGGPSWFGRLSLQDLTVVLPAVVGVLGALLVGIGIFGILRARRRPRPADGGDAPSVGRRAVANQESGGIYGARMEEGGGGPRGGEYRSAGAVSNLEQPVRSDGAPGAVYGAAPAGPSAGGGPYGPQPGAGRGQWPAGGAVYGGGAGHGRAPYPDEPGPGYAGSGHDDRGQQRGGYPDGGYRHR